MPQAPDGVVICVDLPVAGAAETQRHGKMAKLRVRTVEGEWHAWPFLLWGL